MATLRSTESLPDKSQTVADVHKLLALAGVHWKIRTVNALVEIFEAEENVSVQDVLKILGEMKKVKTFSVLVNRRS